MRFQRLIFAVILACGVTACAKNITGVTHPVPPLAYVRYVNAVSDTFNMDFRAVDQVQYSHPFLNVAFRGLGDGHYQGYQAGSRHVRVFLDPAPSGVTIAVDPLVVSTVMVDTTFTFTAGAYYTVVHVGNARAGAAVKEKLWIIPDALPTQSSATVQYRIINTASVQGAVDVYVSATGTTTGTPTASSLAFPERDVVPVAGAGCAHHEADPARHPDDRWCGSGLHASGGNGGHDGRRPDLRIRTGRVDPDRVHL